MSLHTTITPETGLPKSASLHSEEVLPPFRKCYRWRPSFWRIRPILGVFAIIVAISSLIFALSVLLASSGKPTTEWTIQPTVYLAISAATSNTALQAALALAAPISWLYKALRGSTVQDLEIDWEAGQSFPRAFIKSIKYKRPFSLFSIASLATALVLADGPFLQRASTIKRVPITGDTQLNISVLQELPKGFSGTLGRQGEYIFTRATLDVVDAEVHRQPIHTTTQCNGTCHATIRSPGVAVTGCLKRTWPITESMLDDVNATWGLNESEGFGLMTVKPILYSSLANYIDLCYSGREPFWIATGHANYDNCDGQFTFTNCTLLPAIVEHKIAVTGRTVTPTITPTSTEPPIVALANDSCKEVFPLSAQPLAVAGILNYIMPYMASNARLGGLLDGSQSGQVKGLFAPSLNAFSMKYIQTVPNADLCTLITHDPMNDIIAMLNRVLLRAGLLAASWPDITKTIDAEVPLHQIVHAQWTRDANVFHADFRWFFGAATIQLLTITLLLPTYWGWWHIGVELTLSPFHIAKLCDAPMLKGINSGAGALGVVRDLGDMRLKLGCITVDTSTNQEAEGMKVQTTASSRVGIAKLDQVLDPQRGASFTD